LEEVGDHKGHDGQDEREPSNMYIPTLPSLGDVIEREQDPERHGEAERAAKPSVDS
jgi:hypothetical protein